MPLPGTPPDKNISTGRILPYTSRIFSEPRGGLAPAVEARRADEEVIMTGARNYWTPPPARRLARPVRPYRHDHPSRKTSMPRAVVKKLRPSRSFPSIPTPKSASTSARVKQYLARHAYKKPVLLVDLDIVRAKTRRFRAALPRVRPHFAVKANPDPRVLKVLIQEGAGFEIASIAELDLLLGLGVPVAGGLLLQPDEVARLPRVRRREGRRVVRGRQRRGDPQGAVGQGRRQAVPAHRRAQHRQRLAARGQVRRAHERHAGAHRGRGRLQGGPRGRHLPRGLAVPQPGELARGHGARAQGVRRRCARWASTRAC